MLSLFPLNQLQFPVFITLRNPNVKVEVRQDGSVLAVCANSASSVVIARHAPEMPGFGVFMSFWARTVASHSKVSLALTQVVMDLAAGRVEQDPDCPHLFFDKFREDTLSDGSVIYPLLEVTDSALVGPYNPDPYYLNEAYVLARNPRVKLYALIEDCDGHDVVTGAYVGVPNLPGEKPVFNWVSRSVTAAAIEEAVKAEYFGVRVSVCKCSGS